ncbi:MAG: tetratricopeptide repeat protein [Desulfotignum sp.]|nr:tetratricopeptide repeat protein [Desulfotignum sp.]
MEKKHTGTITRQTLYMAILISLTAGFILGAAYTSFKLADESSADGHIHTDGPQAPAPGGQTAGSGAAMPDVDAQVAELEKFLEQNPEDAGAWTKLGHLFFDASRFDEAIGAYQKSLALEPGNPAVLTDMGVMYRRSGEPEKAIQAFDQAVKASPGFETALFNKGVVLMADLNDLAGARKAWEELVKVNPDATTPSGEKVADIVARMKQQN